MKRKIELPESKSIEIEFDSHTYDPKWSAVDTIVLADMCLKETGAKSLIDVGCGAGGIGLALKYLNPFVDVTLSDVSDYAIKQTRKNAKRLNLDVTILKSDLLPKTKQFPVIVTNLPSFDKEQLTEALHGPEISYLASEEDGLYLYKKLIKQVPVGAFLICEVQEKLQEAFQKHLAKEGGWMMVSRTDASFALIRQSPSELRPTSSEREPSDSQLLT